MHIVNKIFLLLIFMSVVDNTFKVTFLLFIAGSFFIQLINDFNVNN